MVLISECSKFVQKEYKGYDWVGNVIYWELSKKMKFDHSTKWYMHKPESVLENETHQILWDFETNKSPYPCQNTRLRDS